MNYSLQYSIYKGTGGKFGALKFSFSKPHFYNSGKKDFTGELAFKEGKKQSEWKEREGCVFVEITSAKDKNVYDWDTKVVMALSVHDMSKLLAGLNRPGETSIMHDPNAGSEKQGLVKKFLNITVSEKGAMFSCTQSNSSEKRSHTVPLSPEEVVALRLLLQQAIVKSLNW